MRQLVLPVCLALILLSNACRPSKPKGLAGTMPATPTAPASQAVQDKEPIALQRLEALRQQANAAIAQQDGAELTRIANAVAALEFSQQANRAQRDLLTKTWLEQAGIFRDGLHRFLFVELKPLGESRRQKLLDLADAQGPAVLAQAGAALAEQEFGNGDKHLRATSQLKPGSPDAATQLPVLRAGDPNHPWQRRLNEAFNAKMRDETVGRGP